MKKIISLTIFLILLVSAYGQCNQPYKALSAFANDTTAFMIYNFADRELCYKGKTVNDVLSDLNTSKVSVKSYSMRVKKNRSTNGIAMITSINIYIYERSLIHKKLNSRLEGNYDQLNSIELIFDAPVALEPNRKVFVNNSGNNSWRIEIQNFFAPMKIKEIRFSE